MDASLILLLVALIALNIQSYYFGWVRPPKVAAWLQQASFIVLTFLLIPLLVYSLYSQSQAESRLEDYGIVPHPAIKNAVGIANGRGDNPIWLFELEDNEPALDFYRNLPESAPWDLSDDLGIQLIFTQQSRTLTIVQSGAPDRSTLAYMVSSR